MFSGHKIEILPILEPQHINWHLIFIILYLFIPSTRFVFSVQYPKTYREISCCRAFKDQYSRGTKTVFFMVPPTFPFSTGLDLLSPSAAFSV